jgi:hypothetical protein
MSENELDALLSDWAARRQLTPARAEAIRLAARPAETAMPRQWWQDLFRSLRTATDPRPFLTAVNG